MPRRLLPILALAALPAAAETPNLSLTATGEPGSAARLILAQRAYDAALRDGEVLALLSAISLARGISQRPATGWTRTTEGKAPAEAPQGAPAAPDPGGDAAMSVARNLAGEDPNLQDLVYALDAQVPHGQFPTALVTTADLAPGESDIWTLPLFGEVAAEIGLIGDGDGPLSMTLTDETGTTLCTHPASAAPILCSLTPARNGFFTVTIHNPGAMVNSYRLIGN